MSTCQVQRRGWTAGRLGWVGWPLAVLIVGWAAQPKIRRGERWDWQENPMDFLLTGDEALVFHNLARDLPLDIPIRKSLC